MVKSFSIQRANAMLRRHTGATTQERTRVINTPGGLCSGELLVHVIVEVNEGLLNVAAERSGLVVTVEGANPRHGAGVNLRDDARHVEYSAPFKNASPSVVSGEEVADEHTAEWEGVLGAGENDSLEAKLHREIWAHSQFLGEEGQRRSGNLTDGLRGLGKGKDSRAENRRTRGFDMRDDGFGDLINGTPQKTGKMDGRGTSRMKRLSAKMTLHSECGRKESRRKPGKFKAEIRGLKNGIPAKTRKRGGEMDLQKKENRRQNQRFAEKEQRGGPKKEMDGFGGLENVRGRKSLFRSRVGNWLLAHLNIFVLEPVQGVELILAYGLSNEVYICISWPAEFYSRWYPKRGINGLVGHPAKSFVRTRSIHPSAFQIIQWIELQYWVHSNRKSDLYWGHSCLKPRVNVWSIRAGLLGGSHRR
ncbi:hypothetical protein DFH09DRAFT_1075827 [Mycena vulgaris]|nr:hypothetical protein DFH09DRAFT_1075827 [Mycena vulgaris]